MNPKIKKLIDDIESQLYDIYNSYDEATDLLGELEEKLSESPKPDWFHLAADTEKLLRRLRDQLTPDELELRDRLIDTLRAMDKDS